MKTDEYVDPNMYMSDLLYPTFLFPVLLEDMHVGSWLIGGTPCQALCKLHVFLADCSVLVSIQSLVLIAVDSSGSSSSTSILCDH